MILMKDEGEERKWLKILLNMRLRAALETSVMMCTRRQEETDTEQLKRKVMEMRGHRGGRDVKS